jgi:hypothetical protein
MSRVQIRLTAAVAALAIAGCDTGGGIQAGIDRGGLTGGAVGTVTGFGSVIVNGVAYDTSGASITVNGAPATETNLEVGYVVVVLADTADGSATPSASSIEFNHDVIGPITAVAIADNMLTILGQTVRVDDATVYGDGIDPGSIDGLAALPAGQVLRISGLAGAQGELLATRIELGMAGTDLEVTGIASDVDTAARTLMIGGLAVNYSGASLEDFGGSDPANGDRVEAEGSGFGAGGELIADKLELKEIDLSLEDGDELEIEGLITSFASPASFSVAGFAVITNAQTEFEDGTAAMLGLNVRVEVEGSVDAGGNLVADEVEFKPVGSARVEANVSAVDTTVGTLDVLGVTIETDAATSYEDKSPAELRPFGLQDINPGDPVRVIGVEDAGAPGTLAASQISRREPLEKLTIRGIATNVLDPQLTVLGVTVLTDAQTDIEDNFFAIGEGRLVQVEGDVVSGSFVAQKVELKD